MASSTIIDGGGTGVLAQVSSEQRLHTLAVSESIEAHHAFDGDGYNFNTGTITLSSASASGLVYLKNSEDEPIVLTGFFYLLGDNTGSSAGNHQIQVIRNPTAGTIIDNAVVKAPVNKDFGSNNTLTGLYYAGVEGDTLTGGSVLVDSLFAATGRYAVALGAVVLRKGNSIGIKVTPATGTTDMDVQMAISLYRAIESTED